MTEQTTDKKQAQNETFSVPLFGYDLIREDLLQDLLGKDKTELLYWAGKRLARRYPLENHEEIIAFFDKAGWGNLSIRNESKHEMIFEIGSELITKRIKSNPNYSYHLEAGFLAQQIEKMTATVTEAFEHPRKKASKVQITVKWDSQDPIK